MDLAKSLHQSLIVSKGCNEEYYEQDQKENERVQHLLHTKDQQTEHEQCDDRLEDPPDLKPALRHNWALGHNSEPASSEFKASAARTTTSRALSYATVSIASSTGSHRHSVIPSDTSGLVSPSGEAMRK